MDVEHLIRDVETTTTSLHDRQIDLSQHSEVVDMGPRILRITHVKVMMPQLSERPCQKRNLSYKKNMWNKGIHAYKTDWRCQGGYEEDVREALCLLNNSDGSTIVINIKAIAGIINFGKRFLYFL